MKSSLIRISLALFLSCALGLQAQSPPEIAPAAPASTNSALTTTNAEIPSDHLKLLLDPLTKDELLIEANGWRDLVKAKVQEISLAEIATRQKTKEIAKAPEVASPAGTNVAAKQEEKKEILDELTTLREDRSALLERLKTVLDAYEDKGGDPGELRKYASAVSGIKVEVTDTSATWTAVQGWIFSKEGGLKWGIRAIQFVAIMIGFMIVAWFAGALVRRATSRNERMSDLLRRFLNKAAQRLILFIGLLTAFSMLGVNLGALLAFVGGGAFIIGFALQDTLGNFAAGLMLLLYHPFDVGDAVELGTVVGKVDNVSLVNTTIRTFDNRVVLVPNKQVWGQVITNITGATERRVDMTFGISYDDDAEKAEAILKKIVAEHPLVLKEPEPVIELNDLGESSVNFICRPWTKTSDVWRARWDITKRVKKEFDAAGITIPFPQRTVHIQSQGANQAEVAASMRDSRQR